MALVSCVECGNQLSEQAKTCPACGSPSARTRQRKSNLKKLLLSVVALVAAFLIFGAGIEGRFDAHRMNAAAQIGSMGMTGGALLELGEEIAREHPGRFDVKEVQEVIFWMACSGVYSVGRDKLKVHVNAAAQTMAATGKSPREAVAFTTRYVMGHRGDDAFALCPR